MREANPDWEPPAEDERAGTVPIDIAWSAFLRRQRWTDEAVLWRQRISYVWTEWVLYQLSCEFGLE